MQWILIQKILEADHIKINKVDLKKNSNNNNNLFT